MTAMGPPQCSGVAVSKTCKPLMGKVALVTGASRGIGRAIAVALAGAGGSVAVGYLQNADEIERLVEALQANAPQLRFTLVGPVNVHHQQVLFQWAFGAPGVTTPAATGVDMALLEEGRIRHLYGFVDPPSA